MPRRAEARRHLARRTWASVRAVGLTPAPSPRAFALLQALRSSAACLTPAAQPPQRVAHSGASRAANSAQQRRSQRPVALRLCSAAMVAPKCTACRRHRPAAAAAAARVVALACLLACTVAQTSNPPANSAGSDASPSPAPMEPPASPAAPVEPPSLSPPVVAEPSPSLDVPSPSPSPSPISPSPSPVSSPSPSPSSSPKPASPSPSPLPASPLPSPLSASPSPSPASPSPVPAASPPPVSLPWPLRIFDGMHALPEHRSPHAAPPLCSRRRPSPRRRRRRRRPRPARRSPSLLCFKSTAPAWCPSA